MNTRGSGWLKPRALSLTALVVALGCTVTATLVVHSVVQDQERRLLKERTSEVGLVLSSAIATTPNTLNAQGGILKATQNSTSAYEEAASLAITSGTGDVSFAWLKPQGSGFLVIAAAGKSFHAGDVISDARAGIFTKALATDQVVPILTGSDRRLGFALGPPAAPAGTVLYRESALGPVAPPRAASTAPFAELDVALYASSTADPAQVLVSTIGTRPLQGDVQSAPLMVGSTQWLLHVKARRALVGSVASNAWWFVLGAGVLASLLLAAVVETGRRRRDSVLERYAAEHEIAETLQRSLLPRLPKLPGLAMESRYLAAGIGQQVGGDWFDAFPVSGGRVGLAVGDVIGHDLEAAGAMAQIRASLRAFAIDGNPPTTVINRLDGLVDGLDLTELVTALYLLLEPPGPDGNRVLQYTNAGHLPPLLRRPDGTVITLDEGDSVLIGAPIAFHHTQSEILLEPGSTLFLFTDGLVERPGESLDEALHQLATTISQMPPDLDVETICAQVIGLVTHRPLRDDIALLIVQLESTAPVHVADEFMLATSTTTETDS